jgi:hypothetical protein
MPQRDFKNNCQVVHLGNLALSGTTPGATAWVDTKGFDSCTFVIVANTVTDAGTAAGISFEVQDSDATAASGATAVADAELSDLETTLALTSDAADNTVSGVIGYVGDARYARIEATGTSLTDADVSVIAILERGSAMPTNSGIGTSVAAT